MHIFGHTQVYGEDSSIFRDLWLVSDKNPKYGEQWVASIGADQRSSVLVDIILDMLTIDSRRIRVWIY